MAGGPERNKTSENHIFMVELPAQRVLRSVLWMGKFQNFFSDFFNFLQ
jgi:hypothetical protein